MVSSVVYSSLVSSFHSSFISGGFHSRLIQSPASCRDALSEHHQLPQKCFFHFFFSLVVPDASFWIRVPPIFWLLFNIAMLSPRSVGWKCWHMLRSVCICWKLNQNVWSWFTFISFIFSRSAYVGYWYVICRLIYWYFAVDFLMIISVIEGEYRYLHLLLHTVYSTSPKRVTVNIWSNQKSQRDGEGNC